MTCGIAGHLAFRGHMLAVVIREDMETVADMVALTLPDGTWAEACDIRGFGSKCEQAARIYSASPMTTRMRFPSDCCEVKPW